MIDLAVVLIPGLPFLAFLLNGLLGTRYSHALAHRLAWGSVGLSFLCTLFVIADTFKTGATR